MWGLPAGSHFSGNFVPHRETGSYTCRTKTFQIENSTLCSDAQFCSLSKHRFPTDQKFRQDGDVLKEKLKLTSRRSLQYDVTKEQKQEGGLDTASFHVWLTAVAGQETCKCLSMHKLLSRHNFSRAHNSQILKFQNSLILYVTVT